tara:strand:- start:237 stop:464 length:228 start_codon:yes stop_codon:yes gene_type:complete
MTEKQSIYQKLYATKRRSIYQKLEETVYPALLRHFKESEGKEYDHQNGTNQCDTRDGMFYYGQIVLCEEILNREI